jgi:hypothetical protein
MHPGRRSFSVATALVVAAGLSLALTAAAAAADRSGSAGVHARGARYHTHCE